MGAVVVSDRPRRVTPLRVQCDTNTSAGAQAMALQVFGTPVAGRGWAVFPAARIVPTPDVRQKSLLLNAISVGRAGSPPAAISFK